MEKLKKKEFIEKMIGKLQKKKFIEKMVEKWLEKKSDLKFLKLNRNKSRICRTRSKDLT